MLCISRARAAFGAVALTLVFASIVAAGITAPAGTTSAAGDCAADPSLDSEELAFLALINNHRAQNGLAPLAPSYTLSKSGAWKSNDLGINAYFAHDDLFRTWVQRFRDCGHTANAWLGENIAGGVSSAQAAFDLWRNSPGHNANMLGTAYTGIGIGRAYVAGSPFGWYWTTEFTSINDPFPAATPTNTPTSTPTKTATPAAPPATPAPLTPVHVGDLDATQINSQLFWHLRVTVSLRDASNGPVAGAIVSGKWLGMTNTTCITGSAGTCVMAPPAQPAGVRSVTFTMNWVAKAGTVYTASANGDPDGDSDGTTIVISR